MAKKGQTFKQYTEEFKLAAWHYTPSVVYPNCLKREFHATAPSQKMVTDMTYISDGTNFHYLSVIQDLFNNEVVAWQLSTRNDVQLVLDTVEEWTRKRDVSEAVLHSDQGFQYTSQAYNMRLEAFGVKGSQLSQSNLPS
ncbi:DDE-type integrase/transposase/recombinase [Paenibacillus paridis]|uniref:DDE-type integrase/transposase/recombinase n=1 Tax=Paenibacillus paridis TaxID=2583376 RepID=UPI001390F460|nr:DDE-type integrase/transposase/recombinase [Paenibacillus paridis]